jgi:hypothetical protein
MTSKYKAFRTKTGYCHITDEQIVLSRDSVRGEMAKVTVGNSIPRILIIYSIISIALIAASVLGFIKRDYFPATLTLILPIYLIFGIIKSWNNSATPIINRKSIKEVKYFKPNKGITRAYFEVYFKNDSGKIKKRLILLPGVLESTQEEIDEAVNIMREEGLLKK